MDVSHPESFPSLASRLDAALRADAENPRYAPLPILLHAHPKGAVPPGPLEADVIERDCGDYVLHGLRGLFQPDGSVCVPLPSQYFWAVAASYRHLRREGCLERFGIPVIAALERDGLADCHNALLLETGTHASERLGQHFQLPPDLL